jgi:hypothetical protein
MSYIITLNNKLTPRYRVCHSSSRKSLLLLCQNIYHCQHNSQCLSLFHIFKTFLYKIHFNINPPTPFMTEQDCPSDRFWLEIRRCLLQASAGHQLSRLWFPWAPPDERQDNTLQIGHGRFMPSLFKFTKRDTHHSTLNNRCSWYRAVKQLTIYLSMRAPRNNLCAFLSLFMRAAWKVRAKFSH